MWIHSEAIIQELTKAQSQYETGSATWNGLQLAILIVEKQVLQAEVKKLKEEQEQA